MLAEEKALRKHLSFLRAITTEGKSEHTITMRLITALVKAVEEISIGLAAERAFEEYVRMFGHSKQNILRAGQIVAAVRRRR